MLKGRVLCLGLVVMAATAFGQVDRGQFDFGPVTGWGYYTIGQSTSSTEQTKRIYGGGDLLYGLREDGSYFCLGNDQTGSTSFPLGTANTVQISVGNGFTVTLDNLGQAHAFGVNSYGQATVPALPNLTSVAAGDQTAIASTQAGTVVGWGRASYGLLTFPAGLNHVTKVSIGNFHAVALKSDGTVVAWGNDSYHQTEVPAGLSGVVDISAGRLHTVALKSDGTVVAWGDNSKGECDIPASSVPYVQVSACGYNTGLLTLGGVASVVGGYPTVLPQDHIEQIATMATGIYGLRYGVDLVGFGVNSNGLQVPRFDYADAVQVLGGLTLKADGTVGNNFPQEAKVAVTKSGGLLYVNGNAVDTDTFGYPAINQTGIKQFDFMTALRNDGTIFWDGNSTGSDGPPTGLGGVTQVCGAMVGAPGAGTNVGGAALTGGGAVYVWGDNRYNQFSVPSSLTIAKYLSYNYGTLAAVNGDGSVVAWGRNDYNQAAVPAGLTGVTKVDTGLYNTVAVKSDGSLVQWGTTPWVGGLIDPTKPNSPIPARCFGGAKVVAISNMALRPVNVFTNWDSFQNGMTTSFTGTVTLTNLSTTATTVTLASSDAGVLVPPSVIVPAGQYQKTFQINMAVTHNGAYSIVASYSGFNATTSFNVRVDDIDFASVTPYSSTINGGDDVMVQVKFAHAVTHPLPLHISTFYGLCAKPTVDVPVGATSVVFPVASLPAASADSYGQIVVMSSLGRQMTGYVTLRKLQIASALFPKSVMGGQPDPFQITLNRPAPASGLTLSLGITQGSNQKVQSVYIAPGVSTVTVNTPTWPTNIYPYQPIQAYLLYLDSNYGASGKVLPGAPKAFLFNTSVVGGGGTYFALELPFKAPAGGIVVNLTSSDPAIGLQTPYLISEGSSGMYAQVHTSPVASSENVTLTATYQIPGGGSSASSCVLQVTSPRVSAMGLWPTSLVGGGFSIGTVNLPAPAPAGGLTVQLAVSGSTAVSLPSSTMVVPAGAMTAIFIVNTTSVTSSQTAVVVASVNGVGVQATLTVTP